MDESYPLKDGTGVCLRHSECPISNCKKCKSLLKRCIICEDGYYLFSSKDGEGLDYCSFCPTHYAIETITGDSHTIATCKPKIILQGNLNFTADPTIFYLSFNGTWDLYFENYKTNLQLEITNLDFYNYECNVSRIAYGNTSFLINCTYKVNITEKNVLKIELLSVPLETESSIIVIREKEYSISMKNYVRCDEDYIFNTGTTFFFPV